jgi:hypothetical protein
MAGSALCEAVARAEAAKDAAHAVAMEESVQAAVAAAKEETTIAMRSSIEQAHAAAMHAVHALAGDATKAAVGGGRVAHSSEPAHGEGGAGASAPARASTAEAEALPEDFEEAQRVVHVELATALRACAMLETTSTVEGTAPVAVRTVVTPRAVLRWLMPFYTAPGPACPLSNGQVCAGGGSSASSSEG